MQFIGLDRKMDTEEQRENDPISAVREVAERHARVRDNLDRAKQELTIKQKQLKLGM